MMEELYMKIKKKYKLFLSIMAMLSMYCYMILVYSNNIKLDNHIPY